MMKWVKRKGLYLPDSSSYAQSVNEFADDLTAHHPYGRLYVYFVFKFGAINNSTDDYRFTILQKNGGTIYQITGTIKGTSDSRWAYRLSYAFRAKGGEGEILRPPQGIVSILEGLAEGTLSGDLLVANLNNRSEVGFNSAIHSYTGLAPLEDSDGYLKIGPPPNSDFPLYVMALVIDNKYPEAFEESLEGLVNSSQAISDSYYFGQPPYIDLHWAMEEGLIDPSQFLHFYTFEKLDENGYVPDYGSNPQPLQLFGNAQIIEAYEVAPYTNPTKATFTPTFASSLLSYLAPQSLSAENPSLQLNWIELARDLWWAASEGPQAPPKEDFITLPAEQVWNGFIPEGVSWEIQQEGSNIYLSTTLVLHAVETEPSVPTTVDDEGRLHFYIFVPEGEMYRITAGALGHRKDEEHAPQLYILWSMPAICLQQGIPPVTVNLKIKL